MNVLFLQATIITLDCFTFVSIMDMDIDDYMANYFFMIILPTTSDKAKIDETYLRLNSKGTHCEPIIKTFPFNPDTSGGSYYNSGTYRTREDKNSPKDIVPHPMKLIFLPILNY
jgi:hypothetical protein